MLTTARYIDGGPRPARPPHDDGRYLHALPIGDADLTLRTFFPRVHRSVARHGRIESRTGRYMNNRIVFHEDRGMVHVPVRQHDRYLPSPGGRAGVQVVHYPIAHAKTRPSAERKSVCRSPPAISTIWLPLRARTRREVCTIESMSDGLLPVPVCPALLSTQPHTAPSSSTANECSLRPRRLHAGHAYQAQHALDSFRLFCAAREFCGQVAPARPHPMNRSSR